MSFEQATPESIADQVEDLDSAESFLDFFNVNYDADIIKHSRIQLLKLFHKNLADYQEPIAWLDYQKALSKAYCLLKHGVTVPLAGSACATCKSDC